MEVGQWVEGGLKPSSSSSWSSNWWSSRYSMACCTPAAISSLVAYGPTEMKLPSGNAGDADEMGESIGRVRIDYRWI